MSKKPPDASHSPQQNLTMEAVAGRTRTIGPLRWLTFHISLPGLEMESRESNPTMMFSRESKTADGSRDAYTVISMEVSSEKK